MKKFRVRTHGKNLGRIRKMRPVLDFYSKNGYIWVRDISSEIIHKLKTRVDVLEIESEMEKS